MILILRKGLKLRKFLWLFQGPFLSDCAYARAHTHVRKRTHARAYTRTYARTRARNQLIYRSIKKADLELNKTIFVKKIL